MVSELRPESEQGTEICTKSWCSRGNSSCKTQGWSEPVVLLRGQGQRWGWAVGGRREGSVSSEAARAAAERP